MKSLNQLSKKELKKIKMIVFDVDGVLVPRGTKIKQLGNITTLETKIIAPRQIEQIKTLHTKGFLINISSGRSLCMLQEMFREILPFVSLSYECGSATWYKGDVYQHVNSFTNLQKVFLQLKKVTNKNIKGFEPKEFIVTIHCKKKDKNIEKIVGEYKNLCTHWNGEAYDVLVKNKQNKAVGLRQVMKIFRLKKENIMAIGDNYNDHELLQASGIPISADKSRVKGKFYVPLTGKLLPADKLMQKILLL
ncbi:HAD-IIB family hydrolase [Candidatus Nomurabacteria bacterium]|nr:HAD-IIB family hydrolase [Candidatus Nomurabacteria bacterium]